MYDILSIYKFNSSQVLTKFNLEKGYILFTSQRREH